MNVIVKAISNYQAQNIIKILLQHKKDDSNDEKWPEKAIKSLVKKLRSINGNDSINELIKSIETQDSKTNCVKIPRSLDGRMQVSSKKGMPHVIYCKLWRWPDLLSQNDLKAVENCSFAFHLKKDEVCVNPYHYSRVRHDDMSNVDALKKVLPSVNVPKGAGFKRTSSSTNNPNFESVFSSLSPNYISDDGDVESIPSPITIGKTSEDAMDVSSPLSPPSLDINQMDFLPIPFEEPKEWCQISYYELKQRVGEIFRSESHRLTIDGFTDPSSEERFCLGPLNNINRDQQTELVRRHIGKGVLLQYLNGEVNVTCMSESAIFVQSVICNRRFEWHPATVVKVPPGCSLTIFNNADFATLLEAYIEFGYEMVFQLVKMCTIRISFVKGWGEQYRRQQITSTPCWVEIHLNGPLMWLDRVLRQMASPETICNSIT